MAAAAEEKRLAEKKKAAELAKRNETYVEVPGYPVHRSPIVVAEKPAPPAPEQQQRVTAKKESQAQKPVAQAEPVKKNAAAKTAENKPAVRTEKVKPSAAAQSTQLAENKPASKVSTKPPAPSAVSDAAAAGEMGSGNYSVQIASWRNAEKATAQANQFTEAGIQAFVSPQGGIYRVCVGRFKSSAAAARRAEELVPMLETKYEIIKVK
jgi:hypothetical protein